jgi:hypothetical protein
LVLQSLFSSDAGSDSSPTRAAASSVAGNTWGERRAYYVREREGEGEKKYGLERLANAMETLGTCVHWTREDENIMAFSA